MESIERELIGLVKSACGKLKSVKADRKIIGRVQLQVPKDKAYGDYAANIALQLSRGSGASPLKIAEELARKLNLQLEKSALRGKISRIEVKPPGFINIFLAKEAYGEVLKEIKKRGIRYGSSALGGGKKVLIEFVSANPTGPLSVAHGRQAAVGQALGNILKFAGYEVSREYYLNDEGVQIYLLGESVFVRYKELFGREEKLPEGGYKGRYVRQLAEELKKKYGDKFIKEKKPGIGFFSEFALKKILLQIKNDLKEFGIRFDNWFSQKKLGREGEVNEVIALLKKKGHIYKKDGALWFRASQFDDEKDRVVVKSDGTQTYLAPDIAYHRDKFRRGFEQLIDIWGPDHHGYIPRIKAAVKALGYREENLKVLIIQLASLYRGRVQIPMSTRAGEYITLRQVMGEVGTDVAKFFFLTRRMNSHLDFDLELAKKESPENPVYYIQYAHARICSIKKFEQKIKKEERKKRADLSLLETKEEVDLIKHLGLFPSVVSGSAGKLEPHRIITYLQQLAGLFHSFYTHCRVVSENRPLTRARLSLVECAQIVLVNGLKLLGLSVPEKM